MEEKQTLKISLSTFCLIIALIAIIVMGYFTYKLYNKKQTSINEINELNNQVSNLEETIKGLQEELETVSNETSHTEKNNSTSTNNTYKQIIIDGIYAIERSDILYRFSANGDVTYGTNLSESKGTYTTVGENEFEVTFVEETIWDDETFEPTTRKINEKIKFKYIDENKIIKYNGEEVEEYIKYIE